MNSCNISAEICADCRIHNSLQLVEPHTELKALIYGVYIAVNLLYKEFMGVKSLKMGREISCIEG